MNFILFKSLYLLEIFKINENILYYMIIFNLLIELKENSK